MTLANGQRPCHDRAGSGSNRPSRFVRYRWAVAVALACVVVIAQAPLAGALPRPAVIAEPGAVEFTVTGGSLGLGGVDVPLPGCNPDGTGCLSFGATIGPDGRFVVGADDVQLPRVDLPLDQLGLALPIGLDLEVFLAGPTTGLIAPDAGLVTLSLGIGIRLVPDLSALGPLAVFARGASCGLGPIQLSLTSGGSGDVTGVPYDPATGAATVVDGNYDVPALGCSPLLTAILPLLAGDALGGVDVTGLLSTANAALGLPSLAGSSSVAFDVVVSRIADGQRVALVAGGALWPGSGFVDVPGGSYFDQAVQWLKAHQITTGLGGSTRTFGPGVAVNRGQMAAFLWRMMDRRTAPGTCDFTDVAPSAFFARSTCWLKANDITTGVGGVTSVFAPTRDMTRGEMALFLWRLAGRPSGSPPSTFTDLMDGAAYVPAVAWLEANSITTGVNGDPTRFAPGAVVTRAQMASFLYRLASNAGAWGQTATLPTTLINGPGLGVSPGQ
jgi:hypothetical protein